MDDFINLEAVQDDVDDVIMEFDEYEPVQTVSDNEFIDDETQTDENTEDYYAFANVSRSAEDVMQDSFRELNSSESHHHEVNNYCDDNYDPDSEQIYELRDSAKRIDEFKCTLLCLHGLVNQDSFYYVILYAIYYQFKNKKDECHNQDQQKQDI